MSLRCIHFMMRLKNKAYGLENEVKRSLEQNHPILAGHTFEHEIAVAAWLGILGSIKFRSRRLYHGLGILTGGHERFGDRICLTRFSEAGGITTGGMNFDAKIRHQSIDGDDRIDGRKLALAFSMLPPCSKTLC
jgi:xylose isomerase